MDLGRGGLRAARGWTVRDDAELLHEAHTDGQLAIIDDVAVRLAPGDPSARVHALGVFGLMVGTLQVSRAPADPRLANEVLEEGIRNALALLAAANRADPLRP